MNDHVFECYEERGDRTQFSKTLEALGEYAAKNLQFTMHRYTIVQTKGARHIQIHPQIQ
jgi:hypothetical protein